MQLTVTLPDGSPYGISRVEISILDTKGWQTICTLGNDINYGTVTNTYSCNDYDLTGIVAPGPFTVSANVIVGDTVTKGAAMAQLIMPEAAPTEAPAPVTIGSNT